MITIKNDTTKNAPSFYDINSDLQGLGIDPATPFPINVSLNWQHYPSLDSRIIVSQIKVN